LQHVEVQMDWQLPTAGWSEGSPQEYSDIPSGWEDGYRTSQWLNREWLFLLRTGKATAPQSYH